jgi:hypothetical protein
MPVVTSYLHGSTAGVPPAVNDHLRAKRDRITGWSSGAVRRHTKWLYAVDDLALDADAVGFALTLTVRDLPASAAEFHSLRRAWVKRLERRGLVRLHWVIEWQRRGVPHLHCAAYFDPRSADDFGPRYGSSPHVMGAVAAAEWVDLAGDLGAQLGGQHIAPIDSAVGWSKYLSKHASRGVAHYQRQGKPDGWETTGRLWGHTGDWPIVEPNRLHLTMEGFHRYRRLVVAWRIADARAELTAARTSDQRRRAAQRLFYARRVLHASDRRLGSVRGISEWIPPEVNDRLLELLAAEGHVLDVGGSD